MRCIFEFFGINSYFDNFFFVIGSVVSRIMFFWLIFFGYVDYVMLILNINLKEIGVNIYKICRIKENDF